MKIFLQLRRLYDRFDPSTWLAIDGDLPVHGAHVRIRTSGTITLSRSGGWEVTIR